MRPLSLATAAAFTVALGLVFFYAPLEADQGFVQKIFYVHVPLAIVSLCGFVLGGLLAIQHLRTRDSRWDMRSYVAIHMSLILGVGTLITGSIWAKASWGHWWVWDEPTLVSFLIVFLLYATYQPLRFSIEDPERQSRYASVFAIAAGAFVPLNFAAVRMSTGYVHPRVLGDTSNLPGPMALTFLVSLLAMALLYATLCKYEMTAKHARGQVRALRRKLSGEVPAQGRSAAPRLSGPPALSGTPAPSAPAPLSPRPAGATATGSTTPAVGRPGG
ncbi:MAG TPA: cytochrome c biogenesis protein CcsA [Solirubrobacteraceae bacterium]